MKEEGRYDVTCRFFFPRPQLRLEWNLEELLLRRISRPAACSRPARRAAGRFQKEESGSSGTQNGGLSRTNLPAPNILAGLSLGSNRSEWLDFRSDDPSAAAAAAAAQGNDDVERLPSRGLTGPGCRTPLVVHT
ncbi:hypothetical protein NOR_05559 [Metarhizium rileyi]|uniref:Uncharacterized protein n=1 Tax=Metarhizium rileyi (strain RCEF 4871) TaxID=1649241 RepID=A0A167CAT3_METRR|nr:hypothetical protein NOR_05559 [Metarhizium rileyi RCEF 4871]